MPSPRWGLFAGISTHSVKWLSMNLITGFNFNYCHVRISLRIKNMLKKKLSSFGLICSQLSPPVVFLCTGGFVPPAALAWLAETNHAKP